MDPSPRSRPRPPPRVALGACFVAISCSFAVAAAAFAYLERNLGPDAQTWCTASTLVGLILFVVGVLLAGRVDGLLAGRRGSGVALGALVAATALTPMLLVPASLTAAKALPPQPDLAPLVTAYGSLASHGVEVTRTTRGVRPGTTLAGRCIVVITDATDGVPHEIDVGETAVHSGSAICSETGITFDPSRHVVALQVAPGRTEAWVLPGFEPAYPAIWPCRLGALRAPPRAWVVAGWVGFALAAGLAWHAARIRRSAREVARPDLARADDDVTRASPYRESARVGEEAEANARALREALARRLFRRGAWASTLGLLVLAILEAPLGVAALAGLVLWRP